MKISMIRIFFAAFICIVLTSCNSSSQVNCGSYKDAVSKDVVYRVSFDDSGVGGLIFALDVLQVLEPELRELESKYAVRFIFHHIGDSKNAPYGSRSPVEIDSLTRVMIDYAANLQQTKTLILACNTASTVYDDEMDSVFREKYSGLNIITMIKNSSREIVDQAITHSGKRGDLYIAILATPATIKSNAYQSSIREIAKTDGQDLKMFTYAPQTWVYNIENGVDKQVSELDVKNDLEKFKNQIGEDFPKIDVAGIFCTHYPFYKDLIRDFFTRNGNPNVELLIQGQIFSDDILNDITRNLKRDSLAYPKRISSIPIKCTSEVEIMSDITGENSVEMKNIILKTNPHFAPRVSFRTVKLK
jgi:glutamate racemase